MNSDACTPKHLSTDLYSSDEINLLFRKIDSAASGTFILAIDGGSASGKTSLAKLLSRRYDCNVFHMDDFFLRPEQRTDERYKQPGGNVDRERFLSQVLLKLKAEQDFSYNFFDCSKMALTNSCQVTAKRLNIIEGAYSHHPELRKYYDLTVFLCVSEKEQERRIRERNAPDKAEMFFSRWIPLENTYFDYFGIKEKSDIILHPGVDG